MDLTGAVSETSQHFHSRHPIAQRNAIHTPHGIGSAVDAEATRELSTSYEIPLRKRKCKSLGSPAPVLTSLSMPHQGPPLNIPGNYCCSTCAKYQTVTIPVSEEVLIWDWLFTTPTSHLRTIPRAKLRGFRDAQTGERLDFVSIAQHSTSLSNTLRTKYTLKAGDTIAIACRNSIWYPVAVFAALRLGVVVAAASPEYGPKELEYAVETTKASIIVVDGSSVGAARTALQNPSLASTRLVCLDEVAGCQCIRALIEEGSAMDNVPSFALEPGQKSRDTLAFLSFTSGTTGLPKAVMISHRNIIAQASQVFALTKPGSAQTLLGVLPLCHSKPCPMHILRRNGENAI